MSSFIVISTTEALNWLVDDIARCRPQNQSVETHIATGQLQEKEDGLYYHYTYGADANRTESGGSDLYALLANQIASFRLQAMIGDDVVQMFLLENPISEQDASRANLIYEELRKVISEKQYENNCHITRVVFSYDIKSLDITRQVRPDYLSQLLANKNISEDNNAHVLYLDNQDRNGAAICSTKEEHEILLPRMLCDFMMLYSSANSAYNIRNAAHCSETNVFSLGYAECMYYYKDIDRFYELAYNKDIREFYLNCPNESPQEENRLLNYEKYPLGLKERIVRLAPRYCDVPYDAKIEDYPNSVDKQINDVVILLQPQIVSIKTDALEKARIEDEEETLRLKQQAEQKGDNPDDVEPVTKNSEQAQLHYPDYIDRSSLYNLWLVQHSPEEESFEDNPVCYNAKIEYENLIKFIQTAEFKQYVLNPPTDASNPAEEPSVETSETYSHKGCNLFARLFGRGNKVETENVSTYQESVNHARKAIEEISSIAQLLLEKRKYVELCQYVENVEEEIVRYSEQLHNFKLTSHSKSYDSLIDVAKLKKHHFDHYQQHVNAIVMNWRNIKNASLSDLMIETIKERDRELLQYKYIDWTYPLPFVKKDIDVERIARELNKMAVPFVNTYTTRVTRENQTTHSYYHDRDEWEQHINKLKDLTLPNGTTAELSTHIESKFCMFHILQMDETIIKGLIDLHE